MSIYTLQEYSRLARRLSCFYEKTKSFTSGDPENSGFSSTQLGVSVSRTSYECRQHTSRNGKGQLSFAPRISVWIVLYVVSVYSCRSHTVTRYSHITLLRGNSGIEAAECGNARTRFCLKVSNSEYLRVIGQPHLMHARSVKRDTNLFLITKGAPFNVSTEQFQTTYAPAIDPPPMTT